MLHYVSRFWEPTNSGTMGTYESGTESVEPIAAVNYLIREGYVEDTDLYFVAVPEDGEYLNLRMVYVYFDGQGESDVKEIKRQDVFIGLSKNLEEVETYK